MADASQETGKRKTSRKPGEPPRVAILVVHGVAAKQAGQSLDEVTDMLTSFRLNTGGGYVRERQVEFPVSLIPLRQDEPDIPKLVHRLSQKPENQESIDQTSPQIESYDQIVMRDMLAKYKPLPKNTHFKSFCNVVRQRFSPSEEAKAGGPDNAIELHFFECFWADLSRGGSYGYLKKFVEFYQFVLDLCTLGRNALNGLKHSVDAQGSTFRLRTPLTWLQFICEFLITGTIPVLNILLLALLLFSPIICQNADFQRWLFPVVGGFLAIFGIARLVGPLSHPDRPLSKEDLLDWRRKYWFWFAMGLGVACTLMIFWGFNVPADDYSRTIREATLCGWGIIVGLLIWWACDLWSVRPFMTVNLILLSLASFTVLLWAIGHDQFDIDTPYVGKRALLHLAEVLMAIGQLVWFAFFFFAALLVVFCGFAMAGFKCKNKDNPAKVRNDVHALQTLRISTALAGLLILLVTICTWQIAPIIVRNVIKLAQLPPFVQQVHSLETSAQPATPPPTHPQVLDPVSSFVSERERGFMDWLGTKAHHVDEDLRRCKDEIEKCPVGTRLIAHLFPCSADPTAYYATPKVVVGLDKLLKGCRYNQIYLIILVLIALLLVILLAFWEVIQKEITPPAKPDDENPRPKKTDPDPWGLPLNEAFSTLEQVGWFISWIVIFVSTISLPILFLLGQEWITLHQPLRFPGFLVICGIVLLAAVAKVFGPMLAVTLDVINWLRDKPRDNTPRARIVARLLAMLTIINRARATQDYDKLIIVAHSQGTVIVAETLRALFRHNDFLKNHKDSPLRNLPDIILFTMGSPLYQLYSRRFPHLFDWVLDPELPDGEEHDRNKLNPNPSELFNLKLWVNAYGAMDYVGRTLWPPPKENESYLSKREVYRNEMAVEFCIGGELTHTHYWDTGSVIAKHLHELIVNDRVAPEPPPEPAGSPS